MSHARIEEVSDSDPEIDDPIEYLPEHLDRNIILPVEAPTASTSTPQQQRPIQPAQPPPQTLRPQSANTGPKVDRSTLKTYQTLYPVYFDSSRSKAQGRRVAKSLATPSPLARTLIDACTSALGAHPLPLAFEPDKTHPKDWANPGRVRIQLFSPKDHRPLHPTIKSKSHLYILIARYLQTHPTKHTDPLLLPIEGLPPPKKEHLVPPAKPRGWRIGDVIPVHSPAMTGGGVNDNFMGDMMKELQGGGGGSNSAMASMLAGLSGGGSGQSPSPAIEQAQGTKRKMDMEKPKPGQGQKDKSGGVLTFGHSR